MLHLNVAYLIPLPAAPTCWVMPYHCFPKQDELESKGVKCGGTHYQRAARLYSLKRLRPEEYPKEVLAKKPKKA